MNMQEKIDELRKANKPKEEKQELSKIYDERSNKYYGLSDNQFRVALGQAYINLYRLTGHTRPSNYEHDKDVILSEVDLVLKEAGRRFPGHMDIFMKGEYFKDPDVASRERRLLPFLCEAAKNDSLLADDVSCYLSWRDGKNAVFHGEKKDIVMTPFENGGKWQHGMHNVEECIRSPYEVAKNVLSDEETAVIKKRVAETWVK